MFALLIEILVYIMYEVPFTKRLCKCPYSECIYQDIHLVQVESEEEPSVDDNPYVLNFMLQ